MLIYPSAGLGIFVRLCEQEDIAGVAVFLVATEGECQ